MVIVPLTFVFVPVTFVIVPLTFVVVRVTFGVVPMTFVIVPGTFRAGGAYSALSGADGHESQRYVSKSGTHEDESWTLDAAGERYIYESDGCNHPGEAEDYEGDAADYICEQEVGRRSGGRTLRRQCTGCSGQGSSPRSPRGSRSEQNGLREARPPSPWPSPQGEGTRASRPCDWIMVRVRRASSWRGERG